jgi:hypothetical protein
MRDLETNAAIGQQHETRCRARMSVSTRQVRHSTHWRIGRVVVASWRDGWFSRDCDAAQLHFIEVTTLPFNIGVAMLNETMSVRRILAALLSVLSLSFVAARAQQEPVLSEDSPVWVAAQAEAEPVVLETIRNFDASLKGATVEVYENGVFLLREVKAEGLERNNLMILVMYQDGKTVVGVFDFTDTAKAKTDSFAAKLEAAIVKAMDAKFKRGTLEPSARAVRTEGVFSF